VVQFGKIGEIESVKSVSDLYTPLSGEVTEANQAAIDNPEVVNSSPYGDGWLIRVRLAYVEEIEKLLGPDEYDAATTDEH
jgi:glycine cleavage system H protein